MRRLALLVLALSLAAVALAPDRHALSHALHPIGATLSDIHDIPDYKRAATWADYDRATELVRWLHAVANEAQARGEHGRAMFVAFAAKTVFNAFLAPEEPRP
jgi:hypothetical protein